MLAIIENAGGDVEKAAEAERRIIEESRQMGSEVFHSSLGSIREAIDLRNSRHNPRHSDLRVQ
jgi:hypothetical protein